MVSREIPLWSTAAAGLGGLVLLVASWLGQVPNESIALSSLWVIAILLLMGGVYALTAQQVESVIGKVGLGMIVLALVLLLVGGVGMMVGGPLGTPIAYVAGVLLLPVGLILLGLAAWLERKAPIISILLLATGIAAGPVAFGLEFANLYPSLGWLLWGVFMGVGWLAIGIAMFLQRSPNGMLSIS